MTGEYFSGSDPIPGGIFGSQIYLAKVIELTAAEALRQINRDQLTNLVNLSALYYGLEQKIKEGKEVGALVMDITKFKELNDSSGHPAGNLVLASFARWLETKLRPADDVIGRIGGDEFAAGLDLTARSDERFTKEERLEAVIRHLNKDMPGFFAELPPDLREAAKAANVSVAIGGSIHKAGESAEAVIFEADANMYKAKEEQHQTIDV